MILWRYARWQCARLRGYTPGRSVPQDATPPPREKGLQRIRPVGREPTLAKRDKYHRGGTRVRHTVEAPASALGVLTHPCRKRELWHAIVSEVCTQASPWMKLAASWESKISQGFRRKLGPALADLDCFDFLPSRQVKSRGMAIPLRGARESRSARRERARLGLGGAKMRVELAERVERQTEGRAADRWPAQAYPGLRQTLEGLERLLEGGRRLAVRRARQRLAPA